jgi:hypothetical protein
LLVVGLQELPVPAFISVAPMGCLISWAMEAESCPIVAMPEREFALPLGLLVWYYQNMTKSRTVLPKRNKGGRPPTGRDPVTAIRLSEEFRAAVDKWASRQDDRPGRSEAIRRLVEIGFKAKK